MDVSYVSLISTSLQHLKVSSTLDKSTGKKNLTDNNPETCWTSRQGPGQYIHLTFDKPAIPKRVTLIFQGGFVGTKCRIDVSESSDSLEWKTWTWIHPEDANRLQNFDLINHTDGFFGEGIQSMKLVFEESSDFYGRITVYGLKLDGLLL